MAEENRDGVFDMVPHVRSFANVRSIKEVKSRIPEANPPTLSITNPPSGDDDDGSGPLSEDALTGVPYSRSLGKKLDCKHEITEVRGDRRRG